MAKTPETKGQIDLINAFMASEVQKIEETSLSTAEGIAKLIDSLKSLAREQKTGADQIVSRLEQLKADKEAQFQAKGKRNPTMGSTVRDLKKIFNEELGSIEGLGKAADNTTDKVEKLTESIQKAQDAIKNFTDKLESGSKVMNTLPAVVQGNASESSSNNNLGNKTSQAMQGPKQLPAAIDPSKQLPGPLNQAEETAKANKVPNSINNLGNKLVGFFSGKSFWGKMLDTIVVGLIASKLLQNTFWDAIKLGFYMIVSTLRRIFGKGPGAALGLAGAGILSLLGMRGLAKGTGAALKVLGRGKGLKMAGAAFGRSFMPKWLKGILRSGKISKLSSTGVTAAAQAVPLLEDKLGKKGISKFLGMAHGASTGVMGKVGSAISKGIKGLGTAAKIGGKKIPLVGALVGAGLGVNRMAKGDWLGGAGEIASGLLGGSGLGIAASLGIDAWLMKRDSDMTKGKKVLGATGEPLGATSWTRALKFIVPAVGVFSGVAKMAPHILKGIKGVAGIITSFASKVKSLNGKIGGLASTILRGIKKFSPIIAGLVAIGLLIKKTFDFFKGDKSKKSSETKSKGTADEQLIGDKVLETTQENVSGAQVKSSTSTNKSLSQIATATLETSENVKKILEHFREESKSKEGGGFWTGLRSGVSNFKTDIQNRLSEGKEVAYGTESELESGGIFGHRVSGAFGEQRTGYKHGGVDFAYNHGEKIYAELGGKVLSAGNLGAYGKAVVVERPDAFMIYGHLSGIPKNIKPGTNLSRGAVLGYAGSTGRSSGTHLHLEVRKKDEKRGYSKFGTRSHEGRIVSEGGFAVEPQSYIKENMAAEMSIPEAGRKEIAKDLQAQGFSQEQASVAAQAVTNKQAEQYIEDKKKSTPTPVTNKKEFDANEAFKTNLMSGSSDTELYMNMLTGRNIFNKN